MPKKAINLLPREEFEKKPLGRFLTWALTAGRYIVIFTELIVLIAFLSRFKLDRDLSDLYDQIQQKQAQITAYSDFEKDFRFFQERLEIIKTLQGEQPLIEGIINTVTQTIPDDVSLNNFSFSENEVKIAGIALSETGLKSFVASLSGSKQLTNISLTNITKEAGGWIKFIITAKVNKGAKNAI